MFEKIKRLGTETAVYGVSTVIGRFLTFLLTPLYANILTPDDLGTVATLFACIAFLNVIYHHGMDSAYMKYVSTLELGDRKPTFTVPFLSTVIGALVFSGLIVFNAERLAGLAGLQVADHSFIEYSALILFLDAVALLPFSTLRMEHRASAFATIKLIGIVVNVLCTVLLLVAYRMGVKGIFIAGAISSGATLLMLIPTIVRNIAFTWPRGLFGALLSFGLPTVPAGLASMAIQVIDRPILEALTDKATVGIYQANYRLGILMMLIVSMFEFAWRPFFFTHAKDPEARQLFARVFTYFLLVMILLLLLLAFFLDDIVKAPLVFGYSILPEPYLPGLTIVPIVLMGYVFLGASTVFSAGVYIEKKTHQLPIMTFLGAAVNIAANFVLIPRMGIMGAALATLLSYGVMAASMLWIAGRVYPVPYEWKRVITIVGTAALVYLLHMFVDPPIFSPVWRSFLLCMFAYAMYLLNFFRPSELAALRTMFRRADRNDSSAPPPDSLN